jgi:hypothetical protein
LRIEGGVSKSELEPMSIWKNIRLELGPTNEFPAGSVSRAYLIRLPLDDDDVVDQHAFELNPYRATVWRFWSTEPDDAGQVLPVEGHWAMHCNGTAERRLDLDGRPIRLGQQISVVEPDGAILPFRVASIR